MREIDDLIIRRNVGGERKDRQRYDKETKINRK